MNIQKINLVGLGSVFRFFVFGFVLSCVLHLIQEEEIQKEELAQSIPYDQVKDNMVNGNNISTPDLD